MTHPTWCERTHAADWPNHSADIGEGGGLRNWSALRTSFRRTSAILSLRDRPPQVEIYRHADDDTTLTSFDLERAAMLARLLGKAVRLASDLVEISTRSEINPVVAKVAESLRVLGCVTRTNAEALLGLCVVELTPREVEAVLSTFTVEGGELR